MVYVDDIQVCLRNRNWPYTKSCHLIADSVHELHVFARKIGLKRTWFRDHPRLPHYDLTEGKRRQVVKRGAIEITARELVKRMKGNLIQ